MRIEGFRLFQSNLESLVTEIKSEPKKTLLTPLTSKRREAKGDTYEDSTLEKSAVPLFKIFSPGKNFKVSGFGVSSVCININ